MNNLSENIDIQKLEWNYDNLELLNICKYLLQVVINDIGLMNNLINEKENYDLGNNYKIKNEDLESLCSIIDTIYFINEYNKEEK